jgi:hypothetical protein
MGGVPRAMPSIVHNHSHQSQQNDSAGDQSSQIRNDPEKNIRETALQCHVMKEERAILRLILEKQGLRPLRDLVLTSKPHPVINPLGSAVRNLRWVEEP